MALLGIFQIFITVFIFLVPLFFTNLTSEYYATNKLALIVFLVPLFILLWLIQMNKEKKVSFLKNRLNLPVLAFGGAYIAATLIGNASIVNSLTSSTGTVVILAFILFYFVLANFPLKKEQIVLPLLASGMVLSLLFLGQFFGLFEKVLPFAFLKVKSWTPAGTLFSLLIFLVCLLPLSVEEGLSKKSVKSLLGWLATVILGLGILFTVITVLYREKPVLLPYQTAWAIAVDNLKNLKQAALGIGPGNYVDTFTANKPLSYNNTDLWAVRFGASSSFLLQLMTEIGLIGLVTYLLIIGNVIKPDKKYLKGVSLSLLLLFLSQVFLPSSILVLFAVFVLLALYVKESGTETFNENSVILPKFLLGLGVVLLVVTYFFGSKWYLGEVYFGQSIKAAAENKGVDTYNLQIKAIGANPYNDNFRVTYAQTNLALANAIIQKGNLSDQDRSDISSLIQQAIREAKIATSLDPKKASNWENLALIYNNLINAANGADQWTITAYNQAIQLDPLNPQLRLNLGGVYYSLKNYDGAIQQFSLAVNLKPNWANAHYNLASALREKGDFQNAFTEMQNTVALVDPKSNDFTKATGELEELRKKLPVPPKTNKTGTAETLTEPQAKPAEIKPKLELPQNELAPEIQKETEATKSESKP